MEVQLGKGSGHRIALQRMKVDGGGTAVDGIRLDTSVPASFDVERSAVHIGSDAGENISAQSNLTAGATTFRLVGNRLEQRGNPIGGAGISLLAMGAGSFRADVLNNVIWDVARCFCGVENGLTAELSDTVHARVDVVANTIVGLRAGDLFLRNQLTPAGHLALDVFNNIFGKSRQSGVGLESTNASTLTYLAGHNDSFQNGQPDFLQGNSLGAGNLHADPHFKNQATGNFTLLASSPVVDKGIVCSPGGIADPDAAGNHRLFGASVDLGAFERGARKPTGVVIADTGTNDVISGTHGDDILCGDAGANDGSKGNDFLNGGAGRDKFRADAGDVRRSVEVKNACLE